MELGTRDEVPFLEATLAWKSISYWDIFSLEMVVPQRDLDGS